MRKGFLALIVAGACSVTPPINDPVVHDLTVVTLSFTDDIFSSNGQTIQQRHDTTAMTLLIDLKTTGAQFEAAGPCGVKEGRIGVYPGSVSGDFPARDGGPNFNLSGTLDSATSTMVGEWQCRTRNLGPHYQSYSGTFSLKRRP